MKKSAVHEESVGDQRVQVRVEVEVFAEGVDGHDHARRAFGQTERGALELGQAAVGDAAEFLDEPAGTVCLRLLFSAHVATYIRERVWHPSQRLRERRDGSLEMRLETSGHKELLRWVLSWVPDVEVLAPRSLRDRVREKLHEALFSSFASLATFS